MSAVEEKKERAKDALICMLAKAIEVGHALFHGDAIPTDQQLREAADFLCRANKAAQMSRRAGLYREATEAERKSARSEAFEVMKRIRATEPSFATLIEESFPGLFPQSGAPATEEAVVTFRDRVHPSSFNRG